MTSFTSSKPGAKKIKASEWNAVRRAVLQPDDVPGGHSSHTAIRQVWVMNDQPQKVPAFGVLAAAGSYRDSETETSLQEQASNGLTDWVRIKGVAPSGNENESGGDELLCIVQRAALPAQLQPAVLMGPTPAWVYVNDTGHRYAKAIEGNVQMLESAESGPVRLIHKVPVTGLQLLPVLLGVSTPGESVTNYAGVVMEAIAPGEDGRVAIYGRNYPDKDKDGNPIEPVYDIIICDELAGEQNEFPEKLVTGTVLADIRGPFRRNKKDGDKNKKESYYVAVNTEGVYSGILADDVTGPDAESSLQIKDANGDLTTLTIHSYYIGGAQTLSAGTGVMVARQQTDGGLRLVIIKSRYAVTQTEPL